jgi:hypothetical protein
MPFSDNFIQKYIIFLFLNLIIKLRSKKALKIKQKNPIACSKDKIKANLNLI